MVVTDSDIAALDGAQIAALHRGDGLPLTVIVPVYNEAATVLALLERVAAAPYRKQIIVVDDGSRDDTAHIVERWTTTRRDIDVTLLRHARNRGKGAAIRTGLARARGDVTLVQDADLEYDPCDYPSLVAPIASGACDVVYGSRFLRPGNHSSRRVHRLCVSLLNFVVWVLYAQRITDEATCYKVFRTDLLRRLDLRCERFEFCPEVTAKLCRLGIRIHEAPICYHPRSIVEGKKIGWPDAVRAFWTLLRWRLARFEPTHDLRISDSAYEHGAWE